MEKLEKERKNCEEKAKIRKVLLLCSSWQIGLAMLLLKVTFLHTSHPSFHMHTKNNLPTCTAHHSFIHSFIHSFLHIFYHSLICKNVTWSRRMSHMSGILILSYRLKEETHSHFVFELHSIVHISATRCPIEMWFGSNCNISNRQVTYIEKSKTEYCRHVTHSPWSCHT